MKAANKEASKKLFKGKFGKGGLFGGGADGDAAGKEEDAAAETAPVQQGALAALFAWLLSLLQGLLALVGLGGSSGGKQKAS